MKNTIYTHGEFVLRIKVFEENIPKYLAIAVAQQVTQEDKSLVFAIVTL